MVLGSKTDVEEHSDYINDNKHCNFRDEDVYGPQEISSWAEMKELEDENDEGWCMEEEKLLAKEYEVKFIQSVIGAMVQDESFG